MKEEMQKDLFHNIVLVTFFVMECTFKMGQESNTYIPFKNPIIIVKRSRGQFLMAVQKGYQNIV